MAYRQEIIDQIKQHYLDAQDRLDNYKRLIKETQAEIYEINEMLSDFGVDGRTLKEQKTPAMKTDGSMGVHTVVPEPPKPLPEL